MYAPSIINNGRKHGDTYMVITVLDTRSVVVSLEAKSSLSRTERRVVGKILVNPMEGCQRVLQCKGINTGKVSTILVTKVNAATCSGLPGIYFAMSDVGAGTVSVRGPRGISTLVTAWKEFVRRKYPALESMDVESEPKKARLERREGFSLLSVTLKPCPISLTGANEATPSVCVWCLTSGASKAGDDDSSSASSSSDSDESSSSDNDMSDSLSSDDDEPDGEDDPPQLPPLCNSTFQSSPICYIIRGDESSSLAIIDCRTIEDIQNLVCNPHLSFKCFTHRPRLIVHLGPREIVQSDEYVNWAKTTQIEKHVYTCTNDNVTRFSSSQQYVSRLATALPQFYPSVFNLDSDQRSIVSSFIATGIDGSFEDVQPTSMDKDETMEIDVESDPNEIDIQPDLQQPNEITVSQLESMPLTKMARTAAPAEISHEEAHVLFLGTGAAKPSTFRGLSSLQVFLSSSQSILLDAGEDTLNQMKRLADARGIPLEKITDSIHFIWISHHHLDHHGGLAGIIEHRFQRKLRTVVFGPLSIRKYLRDVIDPDAVEIYANDEAPKIFPGIVAGTVRVDHCFDSHAIAIDIQASNCRLVYSGDTRPCTKRLAPFRHENLVLVHEATFEHCLFEEAQKKKHSTIDEAVSVGSSLGAKILLLTHASQRYPKHFPKQLCDQRGKMAVLQVHDFFHLNFARINDMNELVSDVHLLNERLAGC